MDEIRKYLDKVFTDASDEFDRVMRFPVAVEGAATGSTGMASDYPRVKYWTGHANDYICPADFMSPMAAPCQQEPYLDILMRGGSGADGIMAFMHKLGRDKRAYILDGDWSLWRYPRPHLFFVELRGTRYAIVESSADDALRQVGDAARE